MNPPVWTPVGAPVAGGATVAGGGATVAGGVGGGICAARGGKISGLAPL